MVKDFSNPAVRLPASVADGDNLNPTDEDVIETVSQSDSESATIHATWHMT